MSRHGYIRIGRVELWYAIEYPHLNIRTWLCGCTIVSLGYVGITWLSKECYNGS